MCTGCIVFVLTQGISVIIITYIRLLRSSNLKMTSFIKKCHTVFIFMISLHNGAAYKIVDGKTVLYLDGDHAYAETPAIPIQTISFSVLCWIKVLSLPSVNIYSDWSSPYQFRFGVISGQLCINLRRASQSFNDMNIVYFCRG